jgi:hypothetical protein
LIIVSESSAEVTQLVRTRRYTPVGCRSSAAHHDIRKYANVQRISVHTEEISSDQWVRRGWSPITAITSPYRTADLVVG